MNVTDFSCDVLIIGSGAAGLSLALRLASQKKIVILSKKTINEGSTYYAQGGIAAVFSKTDSISAHVKDTIISGAGIVDKYVAKFVAKNARHCIEWLIDQGVLFDTYTQKNGKKTYHLTREGGHSHRRILHVADKTGKVVETTLVHKVLSSPNIHVLEYSNAVDLILADEEERLLKRRRVIGAWIWKSNKKKMERCFASYVVLATGGASKVYQYTTNPDIASGDGVAMAWRSGCRVANLEFNQFHPTVLFHPQKHNILLTEALRGEGAYLKRPDGSRFMLDFDMRTELAPRDIVARAINYEMKRLGVNCMYLDISHKSSKFISQRFPVIYKKLLKLGIDLTKDPVPIVPAAHYTCGGIVVDKYGRTDINRLYAIGETSYTGLHGANRIASNSLLECLVYSWSASEDILKHMKYVSYETKIKPPFFFQEEKRINNIHRQQSKQMKIQKNWNKLRLLMWEYVGIVRTTKHLELALRYITTLKKEINEYYIHFDISNDILEWRNLVQVAELIVRCAIMRKESRGLHYILDYPKQLSISGPTILSPKAHKNKNTNLKT